MPREWQQEPQVGQKLWKEGIGSGKITQILWPFKQVIVDFYEKGTEVIDFDDLFGCWTDRLGGTWMLYNI